MCLLLLQIPRNKYKTNSGRNHYKYYAGTIIALYCILQLQFPCMDCICILRLAPRCCEHLSSILWEMYVCMVFTGSTAPYHITQPSTDDYEQRISPNATTANITCALSIPIRTRFIITWTHNRNTFVDPAPPNSIIRSSNAITLLIKDLQLSDLGVYICVFLDINESWRLRRTITLGQYACYSNYITVSFMHCFNLCVCVNFLSTKHQVSFRDNKICRTRL